MYMGHSLAKTQRCRVMGAIVAVHNQIMHTMSDTVQVYIQTNIPCAYL